MESLITALIIFGLRVCDVSLGTVRVIVSIQGRKYLAAAIGFVEVSIFITAIGKAMASMDSPLSTLGYAGGFACGTMLGIFIEGKLALGYRLVRAITHAPDLELVHAMREAGFAVTRLVGEGRDGPVSVILSVVRRRDVARLVALVNQQCPEAFVTIEETRETRRGFFSPVVSKMK